MPSQKQQTVLITGCSPGGIGNALARQFHSRGFRVFATARTTAKISELADLGIETLSLELTDPGSIIALRDEVSKRNEGKLDILVNNAGRNYTMPALDVDMAEVRDTFEANVFSVMRMCKEFSPLLIEAKGTIVQIGSLAGVMPYAFSSVYNASKAALHAYSDTLRVELSQFGVRVVVIATGGVKSNLARVDRTLPEGSYYSPIAEEYKGRLTHAQTVGIDNETYARRTVDRILAKGAFSWLLNLLSFGGRSRYVWEGSSASLIWFASSFLPKAVLETQFIKMFHFEKLRGTGIKKMI
ncbi:NAD(P)-binding protein [Rhizodiscina lignyota]|uniref:NAD(P)-binding protein n=1 Tax=Rhizodiscina lignyota TaxID=1504668 RepID=A0A9P4I7I6_9PEZI|nr:NAD(P)-binding protein [Rhizodiscina lignyota]